MLGELNSSLSSQPYSLRFKDLGFRGLRIQVSEFKDLDFRSLWFKDLGLRVKPYSKPGLKRIPVDP